jgi:two-component system sensor histidine kinase YesM
VIRIKGSIRNKLILFMLTATIIPIAASILITYSYNKETVKKNSIHENSNLIFQGKTNLMHYLSIIDQATLSAYSDYRVFNILQSGYQGNIDQRSDLLRAVQLVSRSVSEVAQVHLDLYESGEHFLYVNGRLTSSPRELAGSNAEPRPFAGYQSYMEATHPAHDYGVAYFPKNESYPVFTLHRPIYNVPAVRQLGVMSVDLRLDFLERICTQLYNPQYENLVILDENGTVVYSKLPSEWGSKPAYSWLSQLTGDDGSFEWKEADFNGMTIYQQMETPFMKWTVVKQIPYSHLYEDARDLTRINAGVYTLFLAIVIVATVIISIRFTAPIQALIAAINKIQAGQLHVEIDSKSNDEIGILARRFRIMMQTLNELILREYALKLANRTNELKALQAQINPHFLNNALQSIGTLALQHQETRIYALIASLGKMMRYQMNTDKTIVPLQQEIDYVKGYLELQQQRFDGKLQVEIEAGPAALAIPVPKMTLQPLVENYFKHGYDSKAGGRIRLAASLSPEEELRIQVADDGRGMTGVELEALREKLSQEPAAEIGEDGGIGLANVIARIRLYYNPQAVLTVEAPEEGGLRVELYIPLKEGGLHHEGFDRG